MNIRERILAAVVLGVLAVAVFGFVFYQFYLVPMQEKAEGIALLEQDIQKQNEKIAQWTASRPRLDRWKRLSLPADEQLSKKEYEKYLSEVLRAANFRPGTYTIKPRQADNKGVPMLAGKKPAYSKLSFTIAGHATLDSLVKMQEHFYETALLQQIRNLSVRRTLTTSEQYRPGELDFDFTVEALIINGAENRKTLLPGLDRRLVVLDVLSGLRAGPVGLAHVPWVLGPAGPFGPGLLAPGRDYASITEKNVFLGPALLTREEREDVIVEENRYAFLTDITNTGRRSEASIYDRFGNRSIRLRASPGFNRFALLQTKEGHTIVSGAVVQMQERTLVFRVELNAKDPEEKKSERYTDRERIYKLDDKDLAMLVEEKVIKEGEEDRVFRFDREFWDALVKEKIVRVSGVSGRDFMLRWDLISGRVLELEEDHVLVKLEEKYCSYRGGDDARQRPRPHPGYCQLEIGHSVSEGLQKPLTATEVDALTGKTAAQR